MFLQRLGFPVYLPILNDKITLRAWSEGKSSETFISNLPEHPSPYDMFNISKLLSVEGRMKATWINLYGVPPLDRSWFAKVNYDKKEGTAFLGRVLISMALNPNDKPSFYMGVA